MAAPFPFLLLLLLAASASARPCKTLFFFSSSSSTSFYPLPSSTVSQNQNPNPNPRYFTSTSDYHTPNRFFLIPKSFNSPLFLDLIDGQDQLSMSIEQEDVERPTSSLLNMPVRLYTTVRSSMKDSSKDIMSVVGALLFGMGCGALTAATMYLIWSLFMPNRFEFEDSDDDEFDGPDNFDDDDPKKVVVGGYAAIPTKVVDDEDLKKPVNEKVAKEGA